ncbi:MAG: YeeE/YedE family protein, partial [Pseudomonadota bacterium]
MDSLRELLASNAAMSLAIGGLVIGFVFGFVVYRTNFCTMGSLSDILNFEDYKRFRSWLLAIALATIGAQLLYLSGATDLSKAMHQSPTLNWLGNIIGGAIFGFGMVFAGGCTSRNLVRAGGGDIRSLIVLIVVGIFAYMTIGGIFGLARSELETLTQINLADSGINSQGMGDILSSLTGVNPDVSLWLVAALFAGGLLIYCLMDKGFRSSPSHIIAGVVVGLCITAGWALTGLSYDEFADRAQNPMSLSYVRPSGDFLEYLMRFTADVIPTFGVASVIGALAG